MKLNLLGWQRPFWLPEVCSGTEHHGGGGAQRWVGTGELLKGGGSERDSEDWAQAANSELDVPREDPRPVLRTQAPRGGLGRSTWCHCPSKFDHPHAPPRPRGAPASVPHLPFLKDIVEGVPGPQAEDCSDCNQAPTTTGGRTRTPHIWAKVVPWGGTGRGAAGRDRTWPHLCPAP